MNYIITQIQIKLDKRQSDPEVSTPFLCRPRAGGNPFINLAQCHKNEWIPACTGGDNF